jgi:hypothetical protein
MTTEERIQEMLAAKRGERGLCELVTCADGFSMSVQASSGHYCSPRNDEGPWRLVEVCWPSADVPELALLGKPVEPTKGMEGAAKQWGWVPIDKVAQVVDAHGGLAAEPPAPR